MARDHIIVNVPSDEGVSFEIVARHKEPNDWLNGMEYINASLEQKELMDQLAVQQFSKILLERKPHRALCRNAGYIRKLQVW